MVSSSRRAWRRGNLAIDQDGADDGRFGVAGGDFVAVVLSPCGQDADVAEFDANAGGAVVLAHGGEEADHLVARIAVLVGHEAVDIGARLVGEEVAERIKDDGVAAVGGAVSLDRLQDVGMVADDDRGSGIEHLVRNLDIFGARGGGVLDAPVDGDDEEIALGAGGFDGGEDLGFVGAGGAAGFAGIGEEVDVGLVGDVGIAIAVEPAGHAEPADLDAIGLSEDGLPGGLRGVSPEPAKSRPASRRWSRVSAKPAQPWSMTWLLAKETILMPLALRAWGSATGASNMKGLLPVEWSGATGVSILTKPKSADWKTSATSREERGPALGAGAGGGCGGTDGFVGNDVSGDGKADLCDLVGIGRGDDGGTL